MDSEPLEIVPGEKKSMQDGGSYGQCFPGSWGSSSCFGIRVEIHLVLEFQG